MKKILCFFLGVCACVGIGVCAMPTTVVSAEEETVVELTNENFFSEINNAENVNFLLTENVVLSGWSSVDFAGRTLDGNGFTITLNASLFNEVTGNSVVKNLGVIASEDFTFTAQNSDVTNFGLLANVVQSSRISSVYSTCVNNMSVNISGRANVGGLIGKCKEGAVVENCFAKVELNVCYGNSNTSGVFVGGFVGEVNYAKIINCYAEALDQDIIVPSVSAVGEVKPQIVTGCFAGRVCENVQTISNVFAGGYIPFTDDLDLKVGGMFGQVDAVETGAITNCHTYYDNNTESIGFVAILDESASIDVSYLPKDKFSSVDNFVSTYEYQEERVWNSAYEWNTDEIWCKKDSYFLVLQVFQTFELSIDVSSSSDLSVGLEMVFLNQNKEEITTEDGPVTTITEKYGTKIYVYMKIQDDYLPYKALGTFTQPNLALNESPKTYSQDDQEVTEEITVCGKTSGVYDATTQNITYKIKVVSENENKGKVVPTNSSYDLTYKSTPLTFEATPKSSSFLFSKWVWLNADGSVGENAYVGATSNMKLAQSVVKVKFGDENCTEQDVVHVYMNSIESGNVEYTLEDDVKTFTLRAVFSDHEEELTISTNASDKACTIYVDDVNNALTGSAGSKGTDYTKTVTVGITAKIVIVVNEGYKFNGWKLESGSLSALINTNGGESALSTEINLKIPGELTLYADISEVKSEVVDLTWLWWTLGGLGGAGLVTLIVILIVKRGRKENFLRYY